MSFTCEDYYPEYEQEQDVYCKDCRFLTADGSACNHPDNQTYRYSPKCEEGVRSPREINIHNDCSWYKAK